MVTFVSVIPFSMSSFFNKSLTWNLLCFKIIGISLYNIFFYNIYSVLNHLCIFIYLISMGALNLIIFGGGDLDPGRAKGA